MRWAQGEGRGGCLKRLRERLACVCGGGGAREKSGAARMCQRLACEGGGSKGFECVSLARFQMAENLDPLCMPALLGRGHILFEQKQLADAMRAYARAALTAPSSPKPRVAMARLYHHQGNEVEAPPPHSRSQIMIIIQIIRMGQSPARSQSKSKSNITHHTSHS